MSYEHNHSIQFDLDHLSQYENVIELDKKKIELDKVYAQAAKADEYEAKAKAFDHIENLVKTELTSDDLYNDARNNDYVAGMLRVYETVDYIIEDYESGEYDAKK